MTTNRIKHALQLPGLFLKVLYTNHEDISQKTLNKNRQLRAELHSHAILAKAWDSHDLEARRRYWYKQMYFLVCLIKKNDSMKITRAYLIKKLNDFIRKPDELEELLFRIHDNEYSSFEEETIPKEKEDTWEDIIHQFLMKQFSSSEPLKQKEIKEEKYPTPLTKPPLLNEDIINIIKKKLKEGYIPVVNNAANSNRDGSAKFSRGSLEEHFARNTNSMFTMLCHFRSIHREEKHGKRFVLDLKYRYLRACLIMMKNILSAEEPDEYINSPRFLEDYLKQTGFENNDSKDIPIHFDLQNTVYEIPTEGSLVSFALFNPLNVSDYSEFQKEIANDHKDDSIVVVHAAAPDQRTIEGAADRLCSRDLLLRNPENPMVLKNMIESGIRTQCKEAIKIARLQKKPYLIFVLPGCGAFGNPIHETAEIFFNEIKRQKESLEKYHIPFCIVEKNPKNYAVLHNYLYPPETPKINWKFKLACCTPFLIFPLLYVAWFKRSQSMAERYQSHAFFSDKKEAETSQNIKSQPLI